MLQWKTNITLPLTTSNDVISLNIKYKNKEIGIFKRMFCQRTGLRLVVTFFYSRQLPLFPCCQKSLCVGYVRQRERDRLCVGKLFQILQCKANQKNVKRILTLRSSAYSVATWPLHTTASSWYLDGTIEALYVSTSSIIIFILFFDDWSP